MNGVLQSMMRTLDLDDPRIKAGIEEHVRRAPRLSPEQLDKLALLFRAAPDGGDADD